MRGPQFHGNHLIKGLRKRGILVGKSRSFSLSGAMPSPFKIQDETEETPAYDSENQQQELGFCPYDHGLYDFSSDKEG